MAYVKKTNNPNMGRPALYKPEYCDMLIQHMSKGFSYETFAATIGICRASLYVWEKEYPNFLDSKKRAFELCQLFWEKIGIDGCWSSPEGPNLNTGVWVFNMKNRFRWTDKVEVSGDETKPILLGYDPSKIADEV